MNPAGVIVIAVGLLSFAGGLFNWNWFMNTTSARGVVNTLRPTGARVFYMVLGVAVIVFGFSLVLNLVGGS
jgi:hypothetical protein